MLVMGIIGGIFGILSSILAMIVGGLGSAISIDGADEVIIQGFIAMLFSILGIIAGAISKNKPKMSGWLLLISGVGGFISIALFYIISAILFIVAGFMGVSSKQNTVPADRSRGI